MSTSLLLVKRLISVTKQHKKPSSPKSIAVLIKVMEKQILQPNFPVAQLKKEINEALSNSVLLVELVKQQHPEEELRNCLRQLVIALEKPATEAVSTDDSDDSEDETLHDTES